MFYYYIFWDIGFPTENGTYEYFNKYIGLRYNVIKSMFYDIIFLALTKLEWLIWYQCIFIGIKIVVFICFVRENMESSTIILCFINLI